MLFVAPAPAEAASQVIWLATPANRNYAGEITNKDFEKSLDPKGELGKLVFEPIARPRTWIMDAALLEDVKARPSRYFNISIIGRKPSK